MHDPADSAFYRVRNREMLIRLDSGIEITRATKHEPIDFPSLSRDELIERTDARHGSKFLADWDLPRIVAWLQREIEARGWTFPPSLHERVKVRLSEPVGYVRGRLVSTITIQASGRWAHCYPDEDAP